MSYQLIKQDTQASDANTLIANFTNVDFSDVSMFVISFQGDDGLPTQGSTLRIGTSSGIITTSDYDLQSIYILSGSASYYGYTNQSKGWMLNNSWSDDSSFPLVYLSMNPDTDKCQCSIQNTSLTGYVAIAGWLDSTLTSLGEIEIKGESGHDIIAGSRLQVYKVVLT